MRGDKYKKVVMSATARRVKDMKVVDSILFRNLKDEWFIQWASEFKHGVEIEILIYVPGNRQVRGQWIYVQTYSVDDRQWFRQ